MPFDPLARRAFLAEWNTTFGICYYEIIYFRHLLLGVVGVAVVEGGVGPAELEARGLGGAEAGVAAGAPGGHRAPGQGGLDSCLEASGAIDMWTYLKLCWIFLFYLYFF